MTDAILILNAGSSSLKFSVFRDSEPPELVLRGQLSALQTEPRFVAHDSSGIVDEGTWPAGSTLSHQGAIEFLLDWGQRRQSGKFRLASAGHRVVHGGTKFLQPVRVDDGVLSDLELLVPLAPSHQPHNVAAIRAVSRLRADASPGCVLRHIISSNATQSRPAVRFTARTDSLGDSALWLSRTFLRVHRVAPAACGSASSSGACGRRSSWKWRKPVRIGRRKEHRNDDGLYAARRLAHGHSLWGDRPWRAVALDGPAGSGRSRG